MLLLVDSNIISQVNLAIEENFLQRSFVGMLFGVHIEKNETRWCHPFPRLIITTYCPSYFLVKSKVVHTQVILITLLWTWKDHVILVCTKIVFEDCRAIVLVIFSDTTLYTPSVTRKNQQRFCRGVLSVEIRVAQISSEFMNEVKETRRMDFGSTIVK